MSMTIEVDRVSLEKIQKKLGDMSGKAPKVLRNALNDTAKQADRKLAKKAQETYVVKIGGFTKALALKRATLSNLEAELRSEGKPLELNKFKVSPAGIRTGSARPDILRAKVLKAGSMKGLVKGDIKAFVAKMKNNHVGVMERRGKERGPLKSLYSNSIPKMIGSEKRVYGLVKPQIGTDLQNNVNKQIQKVLGGYI